MVEPYLGFLHIYHDINDIVCYLYGVVITCRTFTKRFELGIHIHNHGASKKSVPLQAFKPQQFRLITPLCSKFLIAGILVIVHYSLIFTLFFICRSLNRHPTSSATGWSWRFLQCHKDSRPPGQEDMKPTNPTRNMMTRYGKQQVTSEVTSKEQSDSHGHGHDTGLQAPGH